MNGVLKPPSVLAPAAALVNNYANGIGIALFSAEMHYYVA